MARPPIWEDNEQAAQAFEESVNYYFEIEKFPTWTGLAIHLGFESRQSLEDYKKRPLFSYPIKKALLRIENAYEKAICTKNPAGAIFALKNFGWKDKQEVENTVKDERIDESKLSTDDLRVLAEIQRRGRTSSEGVH